MPGVDVKTETISGPSSRAISPGSTYFATGLADRGLTDKAVLVRSISEFEYHFGPRVSYGSLHDDLRTFFSEGGGRAYIGRVVGAAAVKATKTLLDRAGAPLATLRIDARSPGGWANALTVAVADGTVANSVTITIAGTPDGLDEVFRDIGLTAGVVDIDDIVNKISTGSRWVVAVNLGSATAAPNNRPAIQAATALLTGADDRASVVAANYVTAADNLFGSDLGSGAIAVPGQPSSAVGAGLITHARLRNRIAILATIAAQTPTQAKAAATALRGSLGSEHAGIFYPHVKIPMADGSVRTVSPEGYVAGARARAHDVHGPWQPGAGVTGQARFVLGIERELTRAEGDDLDANDVSAIRTIARTTRVYGWRSLSADKVNFTLLTGRDVMNDIAFAGEQALEEFVHRSVDSKGRVFSQVEGLMLGIVQPMATAGGLYEKVDQVTGNQLDPGFLVDAGPSVNTIETLAAGKIKAKIGVRVAPVGTVVELTISKASLTAALG